MLVKPDYIKEWLDKINWVIYIPHIDIDIWGIWVWKIGSWLTFELYIGWWIEYIYDRLLSWINWGLKIVKDVTDIVSTWIDWCQQAYQKTLPDLWREAWDIAVDTYWKFRALVDWTWENLGEGITDFWEDLKQTWIAVTNWTTWARLNFDQSLTEFWQNLKDLGKAASDKATEVGAALEGLKTDVIKPILDFFTNFHESVESFFADPDDYILSRMEDFFEKQKERVENMLGHFIERIW